MELSRSSDSKKLNSSQPFILPRIGQGIDFHVFAPKRRLVLGGVEVPYERGLQGHSDADVVIHALCDALLGAAGLGDIGVHYPDNDSRWKDTDSRFFLRDSFQKLIEKGWAFGNADIMIVAQEPRLASFIEAMRHCLAEDLRANLDQISVKATTPERMGALGRKEGIGVWAVVLIYPNMTV